MGSHQDKSQLIELFARLQNGEVTPEEAASLVETKGFVEVGDFARIDVDRRRRVGAAEVVFCPNKTADQILNIVRTIDAAGQNVLCTRLKPETAEQVLKDFPDLDYNAVARTLCKINEPLPDERGVVGVVAAGTSDLFVSEEAAVTARFMGAEVRKFTDVGVAGIHRLFNSLEAIRACDALVVVAGMEGALPSAVAGLVDIPVIATPTSMGYGANFGGLSALLGMLNSCSPGISVVNIDNGFGAGYQAAQIARGRRK